MKEACSVVWIFDDGVEILEDGPEDPNFDVDDQNDYVDWLLWAPNAM
jgi:hypothetical protein